MQGIVGNNNTASSSSSSSASSHLHYRPRHNINNTSSSSSSLRSIVLHACMNIFSIRMILPAVILLWFVFFTFATSDSPTTKPTTATSLRGSGGSSGSWWSSALVSSSTKLEDNLGRRSRRPTPRGNFEHLVVVAGHAVMKISELATADQNDESWYLLDYQRGQGYPRIVSSHIQKGIEIATKDPKAMLLFSGGQTRHDVGPISEAASYYYLAKYREWMDSDLIERVFLEEFARDSFENLLFSLCRYYEINGDYPKRITVIGFDFKQRRFVDLHRKAIHFPEESFTYIGLRAPEDKFNQQHAEEGEEEVLKEFAKDLYGCNDNALAHKRIARNPFHRTAPYELACPAMTDLLEWCGNDIISTKLIPWMK